MHETSEETGEETGAAPPSYAADVDPIVTRSCATAGCHDVEAEEGLDLRAEVALANLVNVPAEQAEMDRVEPGDPELSYLVHKVQGTHLGVGGSGDQMPDGAPALTADEIALIRAWIAEGALP